MHMISFKKIHELIIHGFPPLVEDAYFSLIHKRGCVVYQYDRDGLLHYDKVIFHYYKPFVYST
jgi:hypothetical protein